MADTKDKTPETKSEVKHPKAPWPDGEAREQMSREESERENLGKHGKNPGWEKKW